MVEPLEVPYGGELHVVDAPPGGPVTECSCIGPVVEVSGEPALLLGGCDGRPVTFGYAEVTRPSSRPAR